MYAYCVVLILFLLSLSVAVVQCVGRMGTVVGLDEDHDVVVKYSSNNRYVQHMERRSRIMTNTLLHA